MSEKIICPLKFNSTENECTSNCAWNAGSKVKPLCAVFKASLYLASLDENLSEFPLSFPPED